MASDSLQSEIARVQRVVTMLSNREDQTVLERYVADLISRIVQDDSASQRECLAP